MRASKRFLAFAMAAMAFCLFVSEASAQPATLRADAWMTDGQIFDIAPSDGITYIGGQFNNVLMFTGNGAALSMRTAMPFPLPRVNGTINAVIPDGAGGWYIGGTFTTVDDFVRNRLAHIFSNGTLDLAWRPEVSGGSSPRVFALAMRGAIVYVGGDFTQISGVNRNNIGALDAITGQVIASWDPNASSSVRALAVDGPIIYAGGTFTNIGGIDNLRIAALDSTDGKTARSWNRNVGANGTVRALVVAGATLYAGGNFTSIGGANRNRLAALNMVTGNAMAWNPSVDPTVTNIVTTSEISTIDVAGTIVYAGGLFTTAGGRTRNNIAAIDANGASTDWDPGANGQVLALAANGGDIFAGGRFTVIGKETRRFIAALGADNGIALPWNPNVSTVIPSFTLASPTTIAAPFTTTDSALVFALATSGLTLYAGGNFRTSGWMPRNSIAAFNTATGRPTAWNPNANGVVRSLVVSGDTVYTGGNFTSIGGVPRNRLAALDAVTGIAIPSWNPNVDGTGTVEVNTIDVAEGIVYVGGSFATIGGQGRINIAALRADNGNVVPWTNPPPISQSQPVRALAVRDTTVYFGGDFTISGTTPRNLLAALDTRNGQLLTTWNPNASGTFSSGILPSVQALVLSGSTVYAGGRFTTVGGHPRNHIVAIDAVSGIPSPTWNPNVSTTIANATPVVRAINISGSTVYFGGEFTRVGSETRNNLAAVRADNGMPTEWNPNAIFVFPSTPSFTLTSSVSALKAVESTIFAGGNFNNIAGMTHSFFAPLGETPLNLIPTLRSMNPKSGKRLQTLEVTFEGTSFSEEISAVNVGSGIAVNSITVTNAKSLTANITISATASTGPRNFFVTNPPPGGGSSNPIPFTISNPAPTVASIVPKSGLRAQTLNIVVTGSNFISGATTASLGPDITVNSVTVVSATRLTASITISANAEIDDHDLTVINAFPGGGAATLEEAFAVDYSIPILSSLSPASGDRSETLNVDFIGAGFVEGVSKVNVGAGIKINSTTVTSAKSLRVNLTIAVQAAPGPRAFSVTNARPGGGVSESRIFTVNNPAPTLARINPTVGGRGQVQDVILIGTNFIAGTSMVSFGVDVTVNLVTVNSDTQITANLTIPLGVKNGNRNVSVTNAAPGGGTASLTNGFNVINPPPILTSVTPTIGSLNQTLEVDLAGANFIAGVSRVSFGDGISINQMTVVNSTRITAHITIEDSAPLGGHDVTVANADPVFGDPAVLPNAFAVSDGAIVHFSVPADLHGAAGDNLEVPLNIDPVSREVGSFDAKLSFNPKVLTFIDYERGALLSAADWQIDVNPGSDAINLGAFAAKKAITKAGTAIVLHFRVSDKVTPGTTVPLLLSSLAATDVTANALPTGGANGLFTVPAEAAISGKLFYFVENKPLAGDTLRVEFDDPEMPLQISDEDGQFEFTDIPLGSNVLLTPRRISGNFPGGTITAGDALKAFKGRIGGSEPLNGYESLAAEVTGDCQLTSGDALAILRRATGKWENFRNFGRDDWRFFDASFDVTTENWCAAPASRLYNPLVKDQTGQNFTGVILGDVNGSFGGSALGKIAAVNAGNGPVVAISDPSFDVGSERINFAVAVSQADAAYNSFDLTLNFETAIHVTGVSLGAMLKPEDWEMDWNAGPQGVLRIAGFSKNEDGITGNGKLVVIQATLARPAKEGEALSFSMPLSLFGVNGKEISAQTAPGKLTFSAKLPQQYALEQNYPNPFVSRIAGRASHTIIKYALPEAGAVSLRIYDMLGQTVRTLASGLQTAGIHTIIWNGRKDDGAPAATGVYLYRLEAGNVVKTSKLILQK